MAYDGPQFRTTEEMCEPERKVYQEFLKSITLPLGCKSYVINYDRSIRLVVQRQSDVPNSGGAFAMHCIAEVSIVLCQPPIASCLVERGMRDYSLSDPDLKRKLEDEIKKSHGP